MSGYGTGGYGGGGGGADPTALKIANNLSDVANAATSRTSLGLGSAATLTAGTGASNVVQLDGTGKLPAVDGSALTGISAGQAELTYAGAPAPVPVLSWTPDTSTDAYAGSGAYTLTNSGGIYVNRHARRSVGRFDGTSYIHAGTQIAPPTSYTVMVAWRLEATGANRYAVGSLDVGATNGIRWGLVGVDTAGKVRYSFGDGINLSQGASTAVVVQDTDWHTITCKYTTGRTDVDLWVDGVSTAITATSSAASSTGGATQRFSIGAPGAYASERWVGSIGAVWVWASALSDADREANEAILMAAFP